MIDMFNTDDRDALIDVMDSFQIAMFAFDTRDGWDGVLLGRNRAFCRLHEVSQDQDVGLRLSEILSEEDSQFSYSAFERCAASRKSQRTSRAMNYRFGKFRHHTSLIPLIDREGKVFRIIGNVVGHRIADTDVAENSALDDLTRLSVESLMPLYKAVHAIELRAAQQGEISPDEQRFLQTFNSLCSEALAASRRLHDALT